MEKKQITEWGRRMRWAKEPEEAVESVREEKTQRASGPWKGLIMKFGTDFIREGGKGDEAPIFVQDFLIHHPLAKWGMISPQRSGKRYCRLCIEVKQHTLRKQLQDPAKFRPSYSLPGNNELWIRAAELDVNFRKLNTEVKQAAPRFRPTKMEENKLLVALDDRLHKTHRDMLDIRTVAAVEKIQNGAKFHAELRQAELDYERFRNEHDEGGFYAQKLHERLIDLKGVQKKADQQILSLQQGLVTEIEMARSS